MRIGIRTLHRRNYKQNTTLGSLKSNTAYSLAQIAEIKTNAIVLDPMCGSGTILIEASNFNPLKIIGGDVNPFAT